MSDTMAIPDATRLAQARASDPRSSAWVAANAGSGKTYVLTRRVLSLLLDGNDPASLLCLTFTKAAATEMSTRVFDELARWTRLEDMALASELSQLLKGERPSRKKLETARCLFAKALETPGGLRIQTIHAFCESLLHQFPLEAGVPASFQVLDEQQAQLLMAAARDAVFVHAGRCADAALSRAMEAALERLSEASLAEAIDEHLSHRHSVLAAALDLSPTESEALTKRLVSLHAAMLGIEDVDLERIEARLSDPRLISDLFTEGTLARLDAADLSLSEAEGTQLHQLRTAIRGEDAPTRKAAFNALLFRADGAPRGLSRHFSKLSAAHPELRGQLEQAQAIVADLQAHCDYASLTRIAVEAIGRFERLKAARGMLDFDDLIAKASNLLTRAEARDWVRFKMDQRVGHILVDEAQDTSPIQWQIIMALAEEFFAGTGRETRTAPTFFAVGDEKQSIYSFQGADPAWFDGTRRTLETKAMSAGAPLHTRVPLTLSFRSAPDILAAVDKVFETKDALAGVSMEHGLVHEPLRKSPGLVEMWPVIVGTKQEEPEDWTEPLDVLPAPHVKLADAIAARIARMLSEGTPAGDILILMRRRGAMLDSLNRALKVRAVPVAGADRLILTDHIAAQDLLVLMQTMLLPQDDLGLATLLKTPLFGLDDTHLERLCSDRDGSVHEALEHAQGDPEILRARDQFRAWQILALEGTPYEFLTEILWTLGGQERMIARLGEEAQEPIDELVRLAKSYDLIREGKTTGMQGFVHMLQTSQTVVRRDMEARVDKVRLMTVHGSKGLEASTVFLVDTCTLPEKPRGVVPLQQGRPEVGFNRESPPLVYLKSDVRASVYAQHKNRLHQRQMEEYRRLLYVAMTRARDHLILTGHVSASKAEPAQGSWYNLVHSALQTDARAVDFHEMSTDDPVLMWRRSPWPADAAEDAEPRQEADRGSSAEGSSIKDALRATLPPSRPLAPLRPSRAEKDAGVASSRWPELDAAEQRGRVTQILGGGTAQDALNFGTLVHALMEGVAQPTGDAARALAKTVDEAMPSDQIERALSQAITARELLRSHFASFGSDLAAAQSEVTLRGTLTDKFGGGRAVGGSIDWLLVTDQAAFLIDFKTDASPPDLESLLTDAARYCDQMAIYRSLVQTIFPDRDVHCSLLWTSLPRLDWLEPQAMDDSLRRLGLVARPKGPLTKT